MRVAIAEDSGLFRSSLALLLNSLGAEVTVAVPSGAELIAAITTSPPDVAILDIRMPPSFTDEGIRTAHGCAAFTPTWASSSCPPTRKARTPASCWRS